MKLLRYIHVSLLSAMKSLMGDNKRLHYVLPTILIEILTTGLLLWFIQAIAPYTWDKDLVLFVVLPVGLTIGLLELRQQRRSAKKVVKPRGNKKPALHQNAPAPEWEEKTLDFEITEPVPDEGQHVKGVAYKDYPGRFRTRAGQVGLVAFAIGLPLIAVKLANDANLTASMQLYIFLGVLTPTSAIAGFIALPPIDRGGVVHIDPIEPSSATRKYLGRIEEEDVYYDDVRHWMYFVQQLFAWKTLLAAAVFALTIVVIASSETVKWHPAALIGGGVLIARVWYCWVKWRYTRLVLTNFELSLLSTFPFKLKRSIPAVRVRAIESSTPDWNIIGEKLNYGRLIADTAATEDEVFHHLHHIRNLHLLKAATKKLAH